MLFAMDPDANGVAVYDLDLISGKLAWDSGLQTAYGYSDSEPANSLEWWTDRIHPDDAMRLNLEMDKLTNPAVSNWTVEYRFRGADNVYVLVRDHATVQRAENGEATRLIGSILKLS